MKLIIRFLVNSNIWVAFCALALTYSSEILLQRNNFSISQFVFFATLFTYNFQRVVRIKKGEIHTRKNWLNKNSIVVYFLMLFAFANSLYHFYYFKFLTQATIFFVATLSLAYPFWLRKIPFIKIFVISFAWTISTMFLLVIENEILITYNISLHLLSRFLFVFAITIPFDIRDLRYDASKIKTIPLFFGDKKAKLIAIFGLLICIIIAVFQQFQNNIFSSNFPALILLYFLTLVLVMRSDKKNSDMYFSFWVESLSILSYVFLAILL